MRVACEQRASSIERGPASAKIGRGSAYVSEGRLLRGLVTPSFRTAFVRKKTERDRGNKNTALTTELYDRGALTTNCWPLGFYDVTEVLA